MQKFYITLFALLLFVNQPNCLSKELKNNQDDKVKVFTQEEKIKIQKFITWFHRQTGRNTSYNGKLNLMCRLYKPGIVLEGDIFEYPSELHTKLDQNIFNECNYALWGNGPYCCWPECLPEQITIRLCNRYLSGSVRRWSYIGNKTYYYKKTTPELMQAIAKVKEGKIIEARNYFFKEENTISSAADKEANNSTDKRDDLSLSSFILCKNIFSVFYCKYLEGGNQYDSYSPIELIIEAIPNLFASDLSTNDTIIKNIKIIDTEKIYLADEDYSIDKINPVVLKALYEILNEVVKNSRDVVLIENKDFESFETNFCKPFRK